MAMMHDMIGPLVGLTTALLALATAVLKQRQTLRLQRQTLQLQSEENAQLQAILYALGMARLRELVRQEKEQSSEPRGPSTPSEH